MTDDEPTILGTPPIPRRDVRAELDQLYADLGRPRPGEPCLPTPEEQMYAAMRGWSDQVCVGIRANADDFRRSIEATREALERFQRELLGDPPSDFPTLFADLLREREALAKVRFGVNFGVDFGVGLDRTVPYLRMPIDV